MRHGYFETAVKLTRSIFRRDRLSIILWVVLLACFSAVLAPGIDSMFPDEAARLTLAQIYDNPIMVSMMGPIFGVGQAEGFSSGAMYSGLILLWVALAAAVMNIFFVVRHTRADEERGRAEVVRSLPVGRLAGLHAAMVSSVIVNAALALLTGVGIAAFGVPGMGLGGSVLYGAAIGATGLVYAAIAALFCQLSSSSSGASALSGIVLGISYLLRAAGDVRGSHFIACLSPLGLAQRSQVYVKNYVWPIITLLLLAAAISAAAYKLNTVRDLGQGFIAAKPGRAEAGRRMRSSLGLSWRLMRTALVSWVVVMFLLSGSYGTVIGDLPGFIGDSPDYLQIIGIPESLVNSMSDADKAGVIVTYFGAFIAMMMTLVGIVPVITTAMRPRIEEREGRAEHVIARAVPRRKYIGGYLLLAFSASVLIQFAVASGLYLVTNSLSEVRLFAFGDLVRAYAVYLPAIWVMIGLVTFLVGRFPKATGAAWGYFGFVAFTSFIGGMLDLPPWLNSLSLFHYIPRLPLEAFAAAPLIFLTVLAVILTSAGILFYGRRDTLTA